MGNNAEGDSSTAPKKATQSSGLEVVWAWDKAKLAFMYWTVPMSLIDKIENDASRIAGLRVFLVGIIVFMFLTLHPEVKQTLFASVLAVIFTVGCAAIADYLGRVLNRKFSNGEFVVFYINLIIVMFFVYIWQSRAFLDSWLDQQIVQRVEGFFEENGFPLDHDLVENISYVFTASVACLVVWILKIFFYDLVYFRSENRNLFSFLGVFAVMAVVLFASMGLVIPPYEEILSNEGFTSLIFR